MNYRKASAGDIKELVRIRIEYLKDDYGFLSQEQEMNLAYIELKATEMGKSLCKKMEFKFEKSKYTPMKYSIIHNFN